VILVTNDDGVNSKGLHALGRALSAIGEVWTVAPTEENSACGHAITLHRPLRLRQIKERCYALDGTPADCVYVALARVLPERPCLVVSGINVGANLGDDVTYSGTIGAALEAAVHGLPAIAVSLATRATDPRLLDGFEIAARFSRNLCDLLMKQSDLLPERTLLNVNVPGASMLRGEGGYSITRQSHSRYGETVVDGVDPRGRRYLWIGGERIEGTRIAGSDSDAISAGLISVTPLTLDQTHEAALPVVRKAQIQGFTFVDF